MVILHSKRKVDIRNDIRFGITAGNYEHGIRRRNPVERMVSHGCSIFFEVIEREGNISPTHHHHHSKIAEASSIDLSNREIKSDVIVWKHRVTTVISLPIRGTVCNGYQVLAKVLIRSPRRVII